MFKLVVLCAFLAAAAAKPDVLVTSPIATYSSYWGPSSTTITKQASSVLHPSPLYYSTPLAYSHFIKKRSPQWPLSYNYISPSSYYAGNPLGVTTYSSPLVHSAPLLSGAPLPYTAAHLIKKRSAPLFPATTYIAPSTYATSPLVSTYTASSPLVSTYSASAPLISSPLYSSPIAYSTHFIKKRSAPLLSTYLAPSSYSHQSRIDLTSTPYISSYSTPFAYSSPIGVSHVI